MSGSYSRTAPTETFMLMQQMADHAPRPDLLHEALLGKAAESTLLAITVYDDDGHLVAANRRAADLLGYPRDELLAYDVGAFTEGGFDRKRLQSQELREGVRLVRSKDGSRTPVAFVVAPATLAGLPYFVAVCGRSRTTILALKRPPKHLPGRIHTVSTAH